MSKPIISADSHVTEHPDAYVSRVDQKYKDRVPHKVFDEKMGDLMVIEGRRPVVLSLVSAAGEDPKELLTKRGEEARFEVLPKGGWDPDTRVWAQERDGVNGEVLYPTIGLDHRIGHFRPPKTITARVYRNKNPIDGYLSNNCGISCFSTENLLCNKINDL